MAKNQTVRLSPKLVQKDKESLEVLRGMAGYSPSNTTYTLANAETSYSDMGKKQEDESKAVGTLKTERDNATAKEWDFHNFILNVKEQVKAQYGDDSNEYQSLGLKKKSERKSPKSKAKTPPQA